MSQQEIERLLKQALPGAEIFIEDMAGDGDHYTARVIASQFTGLPRIKQHQMVYDALKGYVGNDLHALALQTSAPETKG